MSNEQNCLSSRKLLRLQNKKRKIRAFLELLKMNESDNPKTKKMRFNNQTFSEMNRGSALNKSLEKYTKEDNNETSKDELSQLKAEVRERKRLKMQMPVLYLTSVGLEAQVHFENEKCKEGSDKYVAPIFIQDLQHLLLSALLGDLSPYKPRWCQLLRWYKVSQVTLVIVEGLDTKNFLTQSACMKRTQNLFHMMIEILPPIQYNSSVTEELLCIPVSQSAKRRLDNRNSSQNNDFVQVFEETFKQQQRNNKFSPSNKLEKLSRTKLLLNPLMMMIEKFPLPVVNFSEEPYKDYVFTKDVYKEVSDHSPLFALDCEMCYTIKKKLELTRVSIVDENMKVVYDTLVKPENKIINYLTKYSGITEPMMRNVTTTLPMVQQRIREILPPDAILCGQSLQSDLRALRMIHPYVIDTSVIYNLSGLRRTKSGLKLLSKVFLNADIQCSNDGHSSVEDSMATMKLILHKLGHNIEYGDVTMGWTFPSNSDNIANSSENYDGVFLPVENTTGLVTSFYNKVKIKEKSVALIGSPSSLVEYSLQETGFSNCNVDEYQVTNNKEVAQQSCKLVSKYDFVLSVMELKHMNGDTSKDQRTLLKLDKRLMKIFNQLPTNSLFVVLLNPLGVDDDNEAPKSLCLMKIKSNL